MNRLPDAVHMICIKMFSIQLLQRIFDVSLAVGAQSIGQHDDLLQVARRFIDDAPQLCQFIMRIDTNGLAQITRRYFL